MMLCVRPIKNYLFVIGSFLLCSCAHSQASNVNSATQGSPTVSQSSNDNPITWEPITVSQDTISIKYKNNTSVSDTISSVAFILEYYNSWGIKERVRMRDEEPPNRNRSTTSQWSVSSLDIETSKPVTIFDIEVNFANLRSRWILSDTVPSIVSSQNQQEIKQEANNDVAASGDFSSTSSVYTGDPSVYIEKKWVDVVNGNFSFVDSYRAKDGMSPPNIPNREQYKLRPFEVSTWDDDYWFSFYSEVYIKDGSDGEYFILRDDEGNSKSVSSSNLDGSWNNVYDIYKIYDNTNFIPQKKYHVYYRVRSGGQEYFKGNNIYVDYIDDLLTYKEAQQIAREERQKAEQEEKDRKTAEAEAAFQLALSSRNAGTIIRFLRSGETNALSYKRSGEVRDEGILAAAKIITRDNNAEIGDFDASFVDSTVNPINPYAFETDKIYQLAIVQPQQFIEGKIIAIAVPGFPNTTIVLQNVPNLQKVSGSLLEVFMKYTGITTLRLANGTRKEVATFTVLYHYHPQ